MHISAPIRNFLLNILFCESKGRQTLICFLILLLSSSLFPSNSLPPYLYKYIRPLIFHGGLIPSFSQKGNEWSLQSEYKEGKLCPWHQKNVNIITIKTVSNILIFPACKYNISRVTIHFLKFPALNMNMGTYKYI